MGSVVIAFMRLNNGKDVDFVLTRGIICGLITALFLMPALILKSDDKIKKSAHKPFVP